MSKFFWLISTISLVVAVHFFEKFIFKFVVLKVFASVVSSYPSFFQALMPPFKIDNLLKPEDLSVQYTLDAAPKSVGLLPFEIIIISLSKSKPKFS